MLFHVISASYSLSLRKRIKAEGKGKCPVLHGIC